jgi:hypothetical protein
VLSLFLFLHFLAPLHLIKCSMQAPNIRTAITSVEQYVGACDREFILLQSNSLVLYTQYIEQAVSINLLNMTA